MVALAGFVLSTVLIIISIIFNGYVLSVLWGWFVAPIFGLLQLSIVSATGITIVVWHLTHQTHDCEKSKESYGKMIKDDVINISMRPLIALFFGWIIHFFIM